jgi:hypothetical protein
VGGALLAERSGSGSGLGEVVRNRESGTSRSGTEGLDIGREVSRLSSALNDAMRAFRARDLSERHESTAGGESTGERDAQVPADVHGEPVRPKKKAASSPTDTTSMPH